MRCKVFLKRTAPKLITLTILITLDTYAHAETYRYIGASYDTATGSYNTTMRITGSMTTNKPIPANSVDLDISSIILNWIFFDGITTLNSANSTLHGSLPNLPTPRATTDDSGRIIGSVLSAWSLPLATQVGDLSNAMYIVAADGDSANPRDFSYTDLSCTEVTDNICTQYHVVPNLGRSHGSGSWSTKLPSAKKIDPAVLLMILGSSQADD